MSLIATPEQSGVTSVRRPSLSTDEVCFEFGDERGAESTTGQSAFLSWLVELLGELAQIADDEVRLR